MQVKRKHIVEKVAKKMNISADDVDDIVYSYYNHVLRLVNSLEHPYIYVNKLFILKFRVNKGLEQISKSDTYIKYLSAKNPTEYVLKSLNDWEIKKIKLKKLIEQMYQISEDKKNKRTERYEFINSLEK